jgi:hypothetical protein
MPNHDLVREIAAKALSETLQEKSRELAEDVARRMCAGLELEEPGLELQPSKLERSKELRDGAMLIAGSRTQSETLETLLAASSAVTTSCGLLVLRGAQATGYSCIGLSGADNFKRATMDCSKGVAASAISSCAGVATKASELDPAFVSRLGLDSSQGVLLLPVLLKEKVAALLIALCQQPEDDLAGLEVLVQVAQLVLDVQAYRKMAQQHAVVPPTAPPTAPHAAPPTAPPAATPKPAATPPAAAAAAVAHAVVTATAMQEPSPATAYPAAALTVAAQPAAHIDTKPATPAYELPPAPTYSAPAPPPLPAPAYRPQARPQPAPSFRMNATSAPAASVQSEAHVEAHDEAHDKARRFAKLLVEEIKLYNQTKVAEGRARGDLYTRLRDDIEKSRAAYQKRYGESVRDVDYFTQELLRILADNNRMAMGAGFPG